MASITNPPFRQICLEAGAGLAGSEMLSAEQLIHAKGGRVPIERCESERHLVVQIYGRSPVVVAQAARIAADRGADIIDLNMGCPAKKVVHAGAGVALMREPRLAQLITEMVVKAVSVPVTVKMRSGFSQGQINAPQIARLVTQAGACAVTIHARTREAVHTGPFDWEVIRRVRDALPAEIAVIGNGGVATPLDAQAIFHQTGCDAVMIGRAARGNPWIFSAITQDRSLEPPLHELQRVMSRHLDLYIEWAGESRAVIEMRKHLCWYLRGLPYAARLRGTLAQLNSRQTMEDLIGRLSG